GEAEDAGMPRLDPAGGLYTVMDVGRDGDAFVRDVLPATGVIFVPARRRSTDWPRPGAPRILARMIAMRA
ncbi:MAG: hypothetical protein P8170_06940, partial [Gemmatimonadota bacterium]